MAKANKVLQRIGFNDVILDSEQLERLEKAMLTIFDENNKALFEIETFLVGYEDEDGIECHEDGEYLNN